MDIDEEYSPFYFGRDYGERPIKAVDTWVKHVSVTGLIGCGDFEMELLGKPALTGPNGYGKTVLMTLVWAVYDLVSTGRPTVLYGLVYNAFTGYAHLFDRFVMTLVDGSEYVLSYNPESPEHYLFSYDGGDVMLDKSFVLNASEGMSCVMLNSWRGSKASEVVYGLISLADGEFDQKFINDWYNRAMVCDESNHSMKFDGLPYEAVAEGEARADKVRKIAEWMTKRHFSYGETQLLFQLVAMSCRFGLLIIDNAEAGLHPSVQFNYMEIVAECYRRGTQVIFVTNSPEMFDGKWSQSNDLWDLSHPSDVEED